MVENMTFTKKPRFVQWLSHFRDVGSIPGSGRSPGGGCGNLLQYSCKKNPMDRRVWWAMVGPQGLNESDMTEATYHCTPPTISYMT